VADTDIGSPDPATTFTAEPGDAAAVPAAGRAPGAEIRRRRGGWLVIAVPAIAALALGGYRLGGPSLWRDEAYTIIAARRPAGQIVALLGHTDAVHGPYYLIMHVVVVLLGSSVFAMWYFASLWHDEDQRDNQINAKRQQVQILFAKWKQAESWFSPELLLVPLDTVRTWMDEREELRLYRFAIENLYRQQEHVLDESGEKLMSLASRLSQAAPAGLECVVAIDRGELT